jgi:AcrR family transcriptional regulator
MAGKTKAHDEQIKNSRSCIVEALFSLMKNISYSKIFVSDIIKKSGIARPTFYRHYKSKDDIILQFLENCFAPTKVEPPHEAHEYANKGYLYLMSLSLENYVRHGAALKIILNSEAEYLVFQYIKKWESHVLDLYKNTLTPQEYIYLKYTVLFSIAGSAQIICDWIKNDMPIPAERLIEWIREKDRALVNTPAINIPVGPV